MNPNKQFERNIELLNGKWGFCFDETDEGYAKQYYNGFTNQYEIIVPYSYTTEASGINIDKQIDIVWYQREIMVSKEDLKKDIYLVCERIDEISDVYVNGMFVGNHIGGNTAFRFLLNYSLKEGKNLLVIRAKDDFSLSKGRGKQRWLNYNFGCWYSSTNGIYGDVYLEKVNHCHLKEVKMTPVVSNNQLKLEYIIENFKSNLLLNAKVKYKDILVNDVTFFLNQDSNTVFIDLTSQDIPNQYIFWHPDCPELYDIEFKLLEGTKEIDYVKSYFGYREYTSSNNRMLLNEFSYYSKMLLYQGYFKESNITPFNEEVMINDIKCIKEMGFNGIRCHQYIPTEGFLTLCDKMGLTVWIEYPSPHLFSLKMQNNVNNEWMEVMRQKYNHPCVFAWVLFNESWGIRGIRENKEQQSFIDGLYYFSKSYDSIRPVISNDGWVHTKSDILTLHNYEQNSDKLINFYTNGEEHLSVMNDYANGYKYDNCPIMITEFGGCAFEHDVNKNNWGYGKAISTENQFYDRFKSLIDGIYSMKNVCGFCYTQYNDVQQEKNGLVDENRLNKVNPKEIRKILFQQS